MKLWFLPVIALSFLTLPMAAADGTGYIRVRSSPVGPGLYVDGKFIGPAGRFTVPEKYPVDPGSHEITLKDPRYEDFTAKVDVKAGKTAKLRAKMKKREPPKGPFGRLRLQGGEPDSFMSVTTGDTGPIYLNGRYMGFVDELNNLEGGLLLAAGSYDLLVQSQVFGEIRKTVTVEANKVTRIKYGQTKE